MQGHRFAVADGNTWWYRIASSPGNNVHYASAAAFENNGQTSGSLIGMPSGSAWSSRLQGRVREVD
jgi:hypothetical protein